VRAKSIVEAKCISCHDTQRITRVQANRERWQTIVQNMRVYAQGSTTAKPLTDDETRTVLDYVMANFSGAGGSGRQRRIPTVVCRGP
jgi:hypothetical protein